MLPGERTSGSDPWSVGPWRGVGGALGPQAGVTALAIPLAVAVVSAVANYLVVLIHTFDGSDEVHRLDKLASAARRLARKAHRLRRQAALQAHRWRSGGSVRQKPRRTSLLRWALWLTGAAGVLAVPTVIFSTHQPAQVAYLILAAFFGGFSLGVVAMVAVVVRKENRRFSLSGAAPGAAAQGVRQLSRFGGSQALISSRRPGDE